MQSKNSSHRPWSAAAFLVLLAIFLLALGACSSKQPAPPAAGKRYAMKGKVLSVAKAEGSATIDADSIPGFMDAMAMPYPIPDQKALANLSPGDDITADVVVADDGKYHLENIVVTKKADGASKGPSSENLHEPQPGEQVPDFSLVNQDGRTVRMDSFRGKVTLVTFIYTRCPFPDYCPLVSSNFAQIYAAARLNPSLYSRIRFLSISFDPVHDTPRVLRQYGTTFRKTTGGNPFERWQFATTSPGELHKISDFFGLLYDSSQQEIVHSLSTSVITPQGTIYKWYGDGGWKPSDLLRDATQALVQENSVVPSSRAKSHGDKSAVLSAGS